MVMETELYAFDLENGRSPLIIKVCGAVEEFHALLDEQWETGLKRVYS